ncbi:Hypothetical predicted protein, partial [Pelobates cultripes]
DRVLPQRLHGPPLATKSELTNMVSDLKAFFTSELAVLKEELSTVTGLIRATEENVHDLQIKQGSTDSCLQELIATCTQLSMRVRQLEDSARQRNVK